MQRASDRLSDPLHGPVQHVNPDKLLRSRGFVKFYRCTQELINQSAGFHGCRVVDDGAQFYLWMTFSDFQPLTSPSTRNSGRTLIASIARWLLWLASTESWILWEVLSYPLGSLLPLACFSAWEADGFSGTSSTNASICCMFIWMLSRVPSG